MYKAKTQQVSQNVYERFIITINDPQISNEMMKRLMCIWNKINVSDCVTGYSGQQSRIKPFCVNVYCTAGHSTFVCEFVCLCVCPSVCRWYPMRLVYLSNFSSKISI